MRSTAPPTSSPRRPRGPSAVPRNRHASLRRAAAGRLTMRGAWMLTLAAVLTVVGGGTIPAGAEPTQYCGARIEEAEDPVKAAMNRVSDGQDKSDLQAWIAQAKTHIATAKSAAQEEECVTQIELAKTLSQDALLLAAQAQ